MNEPILAHRDGAVQVLSFDKRPADFAALRGAPAVHSH
jgi:hypothetical protein